jgi:hypothetical protein
MNRRKLLRLLAQAKAGSNNIAFSDIIALVEAHGFQLERISGSHHIFAHPQMKEQLNLQEVGGKAKAYQVRQFLTLVDNYKLEL